MIWVRIVLYERVNIMALANWWQTKIATACFSYDVSFAPCYQSVMNIWIPSIICRDHSMSHILIVLLPHNFYVQPPAPLQYISELALLIGADNRSRRHSMNQITSRPNFTNTVLITTSLHYNNIYYYRLSEITVIWSFILYLKDTLRRPHYIIITLDPRNLKNTTI